MDNILFLTAHSDHSKDIYKYALKIAQQFGAKITLCHIYNGKTGVFVEDEYNEQLIKLKDFAKNNTSLLKRIVPLKLEVRRGELFKTFLEIEASKNPDLIVMGMNRNTQPDQIFGRFSLKIINKAKTSVLLIPPESKMEEIEKIIYTTYLSKSNDEKTIKNLIGWCNIFSAQLNVLGICDKHQLEKTNSRISELKAKINEAFPNRNIDFQIDVGDTRELVDRYQALKQADLLVLPTHQSRFWSQLFEPNITEQIANDILIPLLILKN